MDFVFICHTAADSAVANELGGWLERNTSLDIRFAECAEHDLIEGTEQSLAASAIILVLSPASVPVRWQRDRWEPVLLDAEARPRIGYFLSAECSFPELLRRQPFFDGSISGRRGLRRWLLGLFPRVLVLPEGQGGTASEETVEGLRRSLADEPGEAREVAHETARAFVRKAERDFEGVIWLDGTRRTRAGLVGDLASALELGVTGVIEENEAEVRRVCETRRILIVHDNPAAPLFPRAGRCSILATAPRDSAPPLAPAGLAAAFAKWREDSTSCTVLLRDLPAAIRSGGEWPLLRRLGWDAIALLKRQRARAAELLELLDLLIDRAWNEGDDEALRKLEWERGWIPSTRNRARPAAPEPLPGEQISLF